MELIVLLSADQFSKELLAEIKSLIKEYLGSRMVLDFKHDYPNMIIGDTLGESDFNTIATIVENKTEGKGTLLVIENKIGVFDQRINYLK